MSYYVDFIINMYYILGIYYGKHIKSKRLDMKKFIGYMAGVNVCGYSGYPIAKDQYNLYSESDFAQIASWGCDHIRLPFNAYNYADYTKDNPIIEYALEAFDQILYWCKKHGLNLVFDMHTAHGFHYNSKNNTR